MGSTERSLSELLQAAQRMTSAAELPTPQPSEPKVDRSLNQLIEVGDALWPGKGAKDPEHEAHASILLGSRGLDLPHMSSRLVSLDSAAQPQPDAAPPASALEQCSSLAAFLRQHRQSTIVEALHAASTQTSAAVSSVFWSSALGQWEQTKQGLLAAFSQSAGDLLSVSLPQTQPSATHTPALVAGGLSALELGLAEVVRGQARGRGGPGLAAALGEVVLAGQDPAASELWKIVLAMCGAEGCGRGEGRDGAAGRAGVVRAARGFLEAKYQEHMRAVVYSDLAQASLGGVPGLAGLVGGYLGVVLGEGGRGGLEDGEGQGGAPVWPLLYYCLRAGGAAEGAAAVQGNSSPAVVEVAGALRGLASAQGLAPEARRRLALAYKRGAKAMRDPYKRAVYCLLAGCDVMLDHSDVATTTDDYLWCKLCVVDTASDSQDTAIHPHQDSLTLPQLQHLLAHTYGESHFNAYEQPLLYTTVLLLTGQFEASVEFLRRSSSLLVHAVHAALALHASGLLRLPQAASAPLLSHPPAAPTSPRLNLVRLVLLYTRAFEASHPAHALHYCHLLRGLQGANTQGDDIFANCVSELALCSRDFELILGSLSDDGSRKPGLIDGFSVDVASITKQVGRDSERKGLHEDAVRLYELAADHAQATALLNRLLAQVVSLPPSGAGAERERVLALGCTVALRHRTHGSSAPAQQDHALATLLDLATVFDLYHSSQYQEALDVVARLQLVALTREEVEPRVRALQGAQPEVREVMPALLVAALTCVCQLHAASGGRSEQGRAIVTFAGMMPLRLHSDVNATLVQLEAGMA